MSLCGESAVANEQRGAWSGRLGLILAASGSAVGLGNVWKFPYITGVNGGGAFVLVYLLALLVIALPALLSELYIGQKGQASAVRSFQNLDHDQSYWRFAGVLGVVSSILIYSYYSVVGGWIFYYFFNSFRNIWVSGCVKQVECLSFSQVLQSPWLQVFSQASFLTLTAAIVSRGVNSGIEKFNKILMPAFVLMLFMMLIQCTYMSGFGAAIEFLFVPHFEKLSPTSVLEAFGHSFFTISIGVGIMVTYGSYLKPDERLLPVATTVILLDTMIAMVSGIVVFSIVFTFQGEPGVGPSLLFETLPSLFDQMLYGQWFAAVFFSLIAVTALTSSVSLLEVGVSWLTERYPDASRARLVIALSFACFCLGVACSLSFNVLQDFTFAGLTFFDALDISTGRIFLPIAGTMTLLFFGWFLGLPASREIVGENKLSYWFLWLTRTVSPVVVMVVMIAALL